MGRVSVDGSRTYTVTFTAQTELITWPDDVQP